MVGALFDSNILIDYLSGIDEAKAEIARYKDKAISVITWIEVMVGVTPDTEASVRAFLQNFIHLEVDSKVSELAVILRQTHRIKLPDAIILATARVSRRLLVTRDVKDFMFGDPGIRLPYRL